MTASRAPRLAIALVGIAMCAAAVAPAAPALADTTTTAPTPTPTVPAVTPSTTTGPTTTLPPASTTSTTARPVPAGPTTTAAAPKPAPGVPAVPVGTPTTTTVPGAPPPPPPDPQPILNTVRDDLTQLAAIDDYKPAEDLVTAAQSKVTEGGATLQTAKTQVDQAQVLQDAAGGRKTAADSQLRSMAVAAYVGVGYNTPGLGATPGGNGHQGFGTVSTPAGLSGVQALDAQEMLAIVGERARHNDEEARTDLAAAVKATSDANTAYLAAKAGVSAAETELLAAQQSLKTITAAAVTPGAATAAPIPVLASTSPAQIELTGQPGQPGNLAATTTTSSSTSTTSTTRPSPTQLAGMATPNVSPAASPTILGPPVMTAQELAAWFASTSRQANASVPVDQLAQSYAAWGAKTGVRDDLAFAQSVVETGFFNFPAGGQLTGADNNFAGIGACDTCAHGWTFPDADHGVGAQLELLEAYASKTKVDTTLVGPVGVGGCCPTWMALAGKWASSVVYGISIMTVYHQMLTWVIPQRLLTAGLLLPTGTAAQGPQLAPLPNPPGSNTKDPNAAPAAGVTTTTVAAKPPVAAANK